MEIIFLGTAAAEGFPSPYCSCATCEKARKNGGKDLRLRASLLIDGIIRIDISGDSVVQGQRLGISMERLRALLITHIHSDHFATDEFLWLIPPFARTYENRLQVFGPVGMMEELSRGRVYHRVRNALETHTLMPFQQFDLPDGCSGAALTAFHDPNRLCLNYLVTSADGTTLLYAADTGEWPEETFSFVKTTGAVMDLVVMEATNTGQEGGGRHLSVKTALKMRDRLIEQENITASTPFYLTHFSHNGGMLHEDLEKALAPSGVIPAHDGLRVEV